MNRCRQHEKSLKCIQEGGLPFTVHQGLNKKVLFAFICCSYAFIHPHPPPSVAPSDMLVLVTTHLLESWEPIRMTMMQMEERGWKYMEYPVSQCSCRDVTEKQQ